LGLTATLVDHLVVSRGPPTHFPAHALIGADRRARVVRRTAGHRDVGPMDHSPRRAQTCGLTDTPTPPGSRITVDLLHCN
jgi:hypothetical protein